MQFTTEQQTFINTALNGTSLIGCACAGAGKSTTLKALANQLHNMGRKVMTAPFMVTLYEEEKLRFPFADVLNVHKRGMRKLKKFFPKINVTDGKVQGIVTGMVNAGQLDAEYAWVIAPIVSMFKTYHILADDQARANEIYAKHFQENEESAHLISVALNVLELSDADTTTADLNDLLRFPILHKMCEPFDGAIIIDEVQDSTPVTLKFIELYIGKETQVIAMGDIDCQVLMQFAGASREDILEFSDRHNLQRINLTFNFRCARAVVNFTNGFWETGMKVPEGTKEGEVLTGVSVSEIVSELEDSDFVVCLTNAPLMQILMDRLKKGLPTRFRVSKFWEKVKMVLYKARGFDTRFNKVGSIYGKVSAYLTENEVTDTNFLDAAQMVKLIEEIAMSKSGEWTGKGKNPFMESTYNGATKSYIHPFEYTLKAICNENGPTLYTAYTVKGLQAPRVIMVPSNMRESTKEHELHQIKCATYVAYTRAENTLIIAA